MRGFLIAAALLAVGATLQAAPLDKGKWEIVSLEREGKADPGMVGAVRTHDGSGYVITPKKGDPIKGSFKADDTTKPKSIDLMPEAGQYKGKTLRGIYEQDGDTLKVCFASNPDLPRPTEFVSKAGYVVAVHKAVK